MTMAKIGAPKLAKFWDNFRAGYGEGVLVNFFFLLTLFAYFAPSGIVPAAMFIAGLSGIGFLWLRRGEAFRPFWPVVTISGLILLLAFVRSDFVAFLRGGMALGEAYWMSTRYFQAPMVSWFTTWAFVFAAWHLSEGRSQRVSVLISWIIIALVVIQLMDCVGNLAMRNGINNRFFGSNRPDMVIVEASNLNLILLMLFWPLAFFAMARRWLLGVGAAAVAVVLGGYVVDSNAHILVMAVSAGVFFAARYWPRVLTRLSILPERTAAVVAATVVLGFPAMVIWLLHSGVSVILYSRLPASWAHRIDIWTYTVERSLEKPLWGWGYEAARLFHPVIPVHPHNMSLQAWLELGIPGLVLLAAFWFCLFWRLVPRGSHAHTGEGGGLTELNFDVEKETQSVEQQARPYILAAAAAYFTLNVISYGMWKAWLINLGALMLVVGILAIKAVKEDRKLRIQL